MLVKITNKYRTACGLDVTIKSMTRDTVHGTIMISGHPCKTSWSRDGGRHADSSALDLKEVQ